VEENAEEAFRLLSKSAPGGDTSSQYYLGWCYENGQGVGTDLVEAGRWYKVAAEQDDPFALFALGRMHELGGGDFNVDIVEAMRYFKRAAALNHEITITHILTLTDIYKEAVRFLLI
jgi:hypothetical protein